jgi:AraC-like DNA-binding protein
VPPDLLNLLDATLRGTLLALLLLLAGVLWRDRPSLPAARASVAMCAGLALQVVGSAPWFEAHVPWVWQTPLIAVSVANAVLFWIFVQALFDDDFSWRPLHAAAWLAVAALSGCNCWLGPAAAGGFAAVTQGLQRGVPLLFAVLAAAAAARNWRTDLVEPRRRLRGYIVVTGVAYTLVMLAARLASPQGRITGAMATVDVLAMLVMVAPVAWQLLQVGGSELFPLRPLLPPAAALGAALGAEAEAALALAAAAPEQAPPADPAEERLALALQHLMQQDRAYRTENLTLAVLAAKLSVPEYRLRRLINQRLGHRNFNAYVNAFRLDEASLALADPARRELPVLTIALTAGFQSIGPFNRAFKAATGLTPTDFRRQKLADS